MSITDLMENFEIQGMYHIKKWDNDNDVYVTLAEGMDFEIDYYNFIKEEYLEAEITYMYAIDKVLNIEVRL